MARHPTIPHTRIAELLDVHPEEGCRKTGGNRIKRHKDIADKAGASREEMLEAAAVAGLVRMGSSFNAASLLLED